MSSRPRKIACLGEAMIELSLGADAAAPRLGYAGDTLNTAIYLRRSLPQDYDVDFVTVVGRDTLSDRMVDFIASEGVGTAAIRRHPDRVPGLYAIATDATGERSFTYWRDSSAARTLFAAGQEADLKALDQMDLVHYSAITLAILSPAARAAFFDWIDGFRVRGGLVSFDSNYRPRLWPDIETARTAVETGWRTCDIAFPSVDDEVALFGDASAEAVLARIESYGAPYGALKRGPDGPWPVGQRTDSPPAFHKVAKVVDTTAAGDSFAAGFLAHYVQGHSIEAALKGGHECAARVIAHSGAIVPAGIWAAGG